MAKALERHGALIVILFIKIMESVSKRLILTYDNLIIVVRTRFATNQSDIGFVRKKAQTISFVERGFERLGLGHRTVGFSWCSYMVKSFSP